MSFSGKGKKIPFNKKLIFFLHPKILSSRNVKHYTLYLHYFPMIPLLLLLSHSRTILGLLSLIGRWWLLLLHRLCYEIVKAWNTENETRAMIHYLIPLDPFIHVLVPPPPPHHHKKHKLFFFKLCSLKTMQSYLLLWLRQSITTRKSLQSIMTRKNAGNVW